MIFISWDDGPIQCLSTLDIKFWRSLLFLWPQLLTEAICEIWELLAELVEFIIGQQTSCDLELLQELIDHPTYCNQELLLEPVDSPSTDKLLEFGRCFQSSLTSPINKQTSCMQDLLSELTDLSITMSNTEPSQNTTHWPLQFKNSIKCLLGR